jgi:hypothetical protein
LLTEIEQLLDLIEAQLGQRRVIEHRATGGADKAEAFGERHEVDWDRDRGRPSARG